jgi:hypothetical protein
VASTIHASSEEIGRSKKKAGSRNIASHAILFHIFYITVLLLSKRLNNAWHELAYGLIISAHLSPSAPIPASFCLVFFAIGYPCSPIM